MMKALAPPSAEMDIRDVWTWLTSNCVSDPGRDGDYTLTRLAEEDASRDLGFRLDGVYKHYPDAYRELGDLESAYVGLNWDLLGDGLVANRVRASKLGKILETSSHAQEFACALEKIHTYFLVQRRGALSRQTELLRFSADLSRQLYQAGQATLEEVQDREREAVVSEAQLRRFREYVGAIEAGSASDGIIPSGTLPLVEIKIGKLLEEAKSTGYVSTREGRLYWEDAHMKLFARSYLREEASRQKGGMVVGVR